MNWSAYNQSLVRIVKNQGFDGWTALTVVLIYSLKNLNYNNEAFLSFQLFYKTTVRTISLSRNLI